MRSCTKGSNPTDLAEEMLELKSEMFDSLQAQVLVLVHSIHMHKVRAHKVRAHRVRVHRVHTHFRTWQVYGMHLWAIERSSGQQLTLDQLWRMGDFVEFTRADVGLCSPGHKLLRHFFFADYNASIEYKFSWRQQNVPITIGAVDATMKRGSALTDLKIRQTVWSNDANCPIVIHHAFMVSRDRRASRSS
jgi:hypothetical protein